MSVAKYFIQQVMEGEDPSKLVERQMLGIEKKDLTAAKKELESAAKKLSGLTKQFPKLKKAAKLAADARIEAGKFHTSP